MKGRASGAGVGAGVGTGIGVGVGAGVGVGVDDATCSAKVPFCSITAAFGSLASWCPGDAPFVIAAPRYFWPPTVMEST